MDTLPPSNDLALLPGGNYLGMIVGFNATHPIATATAIDVRWREALTKGMKIGRIQLDWVDLEPRAGTYEKDELRERLQLLADDNLAPFLSVIGIEGDEAFPADLAPRIKSGELAFDSPEVIDRYARLMAWVIPMLVEHRGWAIAVGNEPGNFIETLAPAAREAVTGQAIRFVEAARTTIHGIEARMAVTITVSEGLNPIEVQEGVDLEVPFLAAVDFASYNFYGFRLEGNNIRTETDPARIRARIDAMMTKAGDRPVVVQELGAHAGPDTGTSLTGASPATQQEFFETVFAELENRPRFRAAFVFQLVDWDPDLVDEYYSGPFRAEGVPEPFIRQYAESLETVGLLRFADGSPRPAWNTFLSALP
jgi:hypothetical protein